MESPKGGQNKGRAYRYFHRRDADELVSDMRLTDKSSRRTGTWLYNV